MNKNKFFEEVDEIINSGSYSFSEEALEGLKELKSNIKNKTGLTDNGKKVLVFMQDHDSTLVGKDMIEMTGIKGIYPVLNSLIRHGLIESGEPVTRDFTNSKGDTKPKDYKTYRLTEFGRKFSVND